MDKAEALEIVLAYKKAREEQRKARPFNNRSKIVKVLLDSMDGRKIYTIEEIGVIAVQHDYSCNWALVTMTHLVRDGYVKRVGWGKYRKIKNYAG